MKLQCKTVWRFFKKVKRELPYDPAIPLLSIYLDKTLIQKDTCTLVFTAALFTTAKTWKQPKCASTDEWMKKMIFVCVYINTYICTYSGYYSVIKKPERKPFVVTWIDLEMTILSEINQTKKEKYHMISLICGT